MLRNVRRLDCKRLFAKQAQPGQPGERRQGAQSECRRNVLACFHPIQREDPGADLHKEEQLSLLYAAIRELPEIDKALVMLYLDDHSYEEMEVILGINQGALRTKMNRAKEKLKKNIERIQHGA